jgi:flagellar basal-body rod protein FlgB
MLFADLANAGATPALEAMMRFSAQRQRLLAHNVANLSTPGFIQKDASIPDFQSALRRALGERQEKRGGQGPLQLERTDEIDPHEDGTFTLSPETPGNGVLFHDRNNRNLEQLMQGLAENASVFRVATDLLRSRNDMLRSAIGQRV